MANESHLNNQGAKPRKEIRMKKNAKSNGFILILSVLALVVCFLTAAGQEEQEPESSATMPMRNGLGNVVMAEKPPTPLRPLTPEETQAWQNPGQEVPLGQSQIIFEKIDFWHIAEVKKYDIFVVYRDGRLQAIRDIAIRGEAFLAPHKIFCLAAMVLMIASNAAMALSLKWRKSSLFVAFAAFAAAAVAAVAFAAAAAVAAVAFAAVAVAAFAAVAVAAVAAAIVFAAVDEENIKVYIFLSSVFYLFMAIALFV